ncbi:hypothetical protein Sulku_2389 [Sulfuricurvum kujiense DSM 16994]|uniref:Glycosyl transferase family 28 C-terminal domain-containing protein n=1 Tax=Sulfuricurvum kujiense (strain ATCC BAA-921 / DSM 16994 / JCM 11577 / YK-1) TaxID=709032 RepID=E4TYA4_SULKY|nr:hypothetical protein [Sulfuricurvum kujiense]ADR35049.1 hypothetical protein Sulku_2389 [Sulfuricurvum kujiense DSM 16994]
MTKILFRADAKPSIGTGDLISLLHLSRYLEGFELYFLTQKTQAALGIMERFNPKNLYWLDENASLEDDITAINALIENENIAIVFFEITERKLTDYTGIDPSAIKVCVNFDGYIPDDIALLINWDAAAHDYYVPERFPQTKFLLGPRYVILPQPFYDKTLRERRNPSVRSEILIAMGGADELDFTALVSEALSEGNYRLNIIVGAGYANHKKLKKMLDGKQCRYSLKLNVQDMLKEYLSCDFAIGAGGLTASELVASRTPCALIATYEHQIARCRYFAHEGWATYLGYRTFDPQKLRDAIETFTPRFGDTLFNTMAIADELRALGRIG